LSDWARDEDVNPTVGKAMFAHWMALLKEKSLDRLPIHTAARKETTYRVLAYFCKRYNYTLAADSDRDANFRSVTLVPNSPK
jgi:hypothetical protein